MFAWGKKKRLQLFCCKMSQLFPVGKTKSGNGPARRAGPSRTGAAGTGPPDAPDAPDRSRRWPKTPAGTGPGRRPRSVDGGTVWTILLLRHFRSRMKYELYRETLNMILGNLGCVANKVTHMAWKNWLGWLSCRAGRAGKWCRNHVKMMKKKLCGNGEIKKNKNIGEIKVYHWQNNSVTLEK